MEDNSCIERHVFGCKVMSVQVFSIVLATTLRAVEIALCAFYPNMPRFALLRSAVSWVSLTVPLQNHLSCMKQHTCADAHSLPALCLQALSLAKAACRVLFKPRAMSMKLGRILHTRTSTLARLAGECHGQQQGAACSWRCCRDQ